MLTQFGERFATESEIKNNASEIDITKMKIEGAGLPLIVDGNSMVVDNSENHSFIIGATGSGKSRRAIFPMIYQFAKAGENFCVNDPKGEAYARTASFLKKCGYRTIVLNLRDFERGDRWNPLGKIYKEFRRGNEDKAQRLIADMASILSQTHKEKTNDIYWGTMSEAMLKLFVTIVAKYGNEDEVNMASIVRCACNDGIEELKKLTSMLPQDSMEAIDLKSILCGIPEKTLMCIQSTLYSSLSMFMSEKKLTAMLSSSTFELEELANPKTAIFIITPDEKNTFNAIVSIFISQLYQTLISVAQKNDNKALEVRYNFLLDEFANLPAIRDFSSAITAARSRNIRYFIVAQGLSQLKEKYGDDVQTIMGNCTIMYLYSHELPLLELLSQMCGERILSSGYAKPLITVPQLQRFKMGEALILLPRQRPFITTSLQDIEEYEHFKCEVTSLPPKEELKPPTVIKPEILVEEIKIGERTDPSVKKENTPGFMQKPMRRERYETLQRQLEKHFDDMFGATEE